MESSRKIISHLFAVFFLIPVLTVINFAQSSDSSSGSGIQKTLACPSENSIRGFKAGKLPVGFDGSISTSVRVHAIANMTECSTLCCSWDECNLAIMFNSTCYNVKCKDNKACTPVAVDDNRAGLFFGTRVVRNFVGDPETEKKDAEPVQCEYGVETSCIQNEVCVRLNARSRQGVCQCMDGYVRNSMGSCIKVTTGNSTLTTESVSMLAAETTIPTLTPEPYITKVEISVSPTHVQLPAADITLTSFVIPMNPPDGGKYSYKWTLLSYPEEGTAGTVGKNDEPTLKLSQLIPGNYSFRLTVNSTLAFGETNITLVVSPPVRLGPVAVIRPETQTVHLPNNESVLDGTLSNDDVGIASFLWELQAGPIGFSFENSGTKTLQLKDLIYGNYTFKLTVTDTDGISNSTTATLFVLRETDYPPVANAGSNVVIFLPQKELILNGNQSTDDHGIVTWEWTRLVSEAGENGLDLSKPVDMKNTNTPYLQLSNLEEGMYTFQLKVTDAAEQSSAAQVHVFVQPPTGLPPKVDAGPDIFISLPTNWVYLNASRNADAANVVTWRWFQIRGPTQAVLLGQDTAGVNATSLTVGEYVFGVTGRDARGLSSNDTVLVTVIQKENQRPRANAGGDRTLMLPAESVSLNGSRSSDDLAVQSWSWTREPDSLAAASIVGNSDKTAVLTLTDLVPGRYVFRLTVSDAQGLADSDVATLVVHPDPNELNLVMFTAKISARTFSENDLNILREQIAFYVHEEKPLVEVRKVGVDLKSGFISLQFLVAVRVANETKVVDGKKVAEELKRRIRMDPYLFKFPVHELDTVICQNPCSGHGSCDQTTRQCLCDAFWMENLIAVYNGADHNCEWSVLYVGVVILILVGFLLLLIWTLVAFIRTGSLPCKKWLAKRRRKMHRYSPLSHPENIRMSTKNTTLLESDDSDSGSDVVFDTSPGNGHLKTANNNRPLKSSAQVHTDNEDNIASTIKA